MLIEIGCIFSKLEEVSFIYFNYFRNKVKQVLIWVENVLKIQGCVSRDEIFDDIHSLIGTNSNTHTHTHTRSTFIMGQKYSVIKDLTREVEKYEREKYEKNQVNTSFFI